MKTIKINETAFLDEGEWKGYVYPEEFFDEVFVIFGNPDYKGVKEASWFKKALEYLEENDRPETDVEILKALKILFPDDEYDYCSITGSVQGEWQQVIYKKKEVIGFDKEYLADFYFGYVAEVIDEEENLCEWTSYSELWDAEYKGNLKEYIRDLMQLGDEDFRILKCDGHVTVPNWKEVG